VTRTALAAIRLYQRTLSPDHGLMARLRREPFCPHEPTCSEYAVKAIETQGLRRGLVLATRRVSSCGRRVASHDFVPRASDDRAV